MPPAITTFSNNQARDSLYELFYGPLDLVFIVGVVMTFIAVIMTHGAIAGEKERGSLRQILSNSVPRAKIIFAKTAAHWLLLIIPFMAAITLGLIILEVQSGPTLINGSAWTFIGLAVLLSALLVGVFFNLGLLISASTKQSVSALVTLLLVWVLAYGLYPRLASGIAQLIYPVKSEARLSLDKELVRRNIEKLQNAEIDAVVRTMPEDYESPAYKDAEKKQDEIGARYRAQLEQTWQLIEREAEARREARLALATNIARLSPVSCFVRPLAELARTGWLEYKQFDTQVRQYEGVLNREIFDKRKVYRYKQGSSFDDNLDFDASAPVFTYSHVPMESVIKDILPDLTLLILFNLVLFTGAFVAFIRYDVR
jgi:ABC-type transport system involved in multi-copper enzyme maturation permease subunit